MLIGMFFAGLSVVGLLTVANLYVHCRVLAKVKAIQPMVKAIQTMVTEEAASWEAVTSLIEASSSTGG